MATSYCCSGNFALIAQQMLLSAVNGNSSKPFPLSVLCTALHSSIMRRIAYTSSDQFVKVLEVNQVKGELMR